MTKKEFKEYIDVHHYGRGRKPENTLAIFYDWKTGDNYNGYKYCIYARVCNATQKELFDLLYAFVLDNETPIPWYVNVVMAESNELRFKVPLGSNGLYFMITDKKRQAYLETLKAIAQS